VIDIIVGVVLFAAFLLGLGLGIKEEFHWHHWHTLKSVPAPNPILPKRCTRRLDERYYITRILERCCGCGSERFEPHRSL
jgi:hypothetical protein